MNYHPSIDHYIDFILLLAKDWVIAQTIERMRRDLEADERAYEERLAEARQREEVMRRMAKARVVKKAVCSDIFPLVGHILNGISTRNTLTTQTWMKTQKTMISFFRKQTKPKPLRMGKSTYPQLFAL